LIKQAAISISLIFVPFAAAQPGALGDIRQDEQREISEQTGQDYAKLTTFSSDNR